MSKNVFLKNLMDGSENNIIRQLTTVGILKRGPRVNPPLRYNRNIAKCQTFYKISFGQQ